MLCATSLTPLFTYRASRKDTTQLGRARTCPLLEAKFCWNLAKSSALSTLTNAITDSRQECQRTLKTMKVVKLTYASVFQSSVPAHCQQKYKQSSKIFSKKQSRSVKRMWRLLTWRSCNASPQSQLLTNPTQPTLKRLKT